jgi:hypothetical protein
MEEFGEEFVIFKKILALFGIDFLLEFLKGRG